jgi:uncharacterized protein (DUF2147 family)
MKKVSFPKVFFTFGIKFLKLFIMKHLLFILFLLCPISAFSQVSAIVGSWKTIDDKTGEAKSIVRIYKETDGKYYGKIERLFQNPEKRCDQCKGDLKDKPILGMVIVTEMQEKGDRLEGGYILDPANGEKYNASITYDKESKKLKLRGSLDRFGLIGRNQFWEKE